MATAQDDERCLVCLHFGVPYVPTLQLLARLNAINLFANQMGSRGVHLWKPAKTPCCRQWLHVLCLMRFCLTQFGDGPANREDWCCPHCRTFLTPLGASSEGGDTVSVTDSETQTETGTETQTDTETEDDTPSPSADDADDEMSSDTTSTVAFSFVSGDLEDDVTDAELSRDEDITDAELSENDGTYGFVWLDTPPYTDEEAS